jgi:DNA-binding phage protein
MGRDTIRNQTPDLFSVGPTSSKAISEPETAPPSRRVVLPKDLPAAIRHLDDRELDLLLRAANDEARKRGMSTANRDVVSSATDTSSPRKNASSLRGQMRQRKMKLSVSSLTHGQVNAVRAAFKAGVTPTTIARQFGLTQADVRKALSSNEPRR